MSPTALRHRLTALLLGLVGVWAPLGSQTLALRHFDHRDGLPQSQIYALLEDRSGFIWVGTFQGGVARLGPGGFTPIGPAQGLQGRAISALREDAHGAIWVGTFDDGVAEIRGEVATRFGPEQGLETREVFALALDSGGDVLAGTRDGLFRATQRRFSRVPLPPDWLHASIFSVVGDGAGGLWVGGQKGRLAHWDGRALRPAALPQGWTEEPVLDLVQGPRGQIYALQAHGLYGLDPQGAWKRVELPIPATAKLRRLTFDGTGRMVLALEGDGLLIREPLGQTRLLSVKEGLPRDRINIALMDSRGSLWVGSDGDGLAVQVLPNLRVLHENPETGASLGLGAVTRFVEQGPGDVLVGSSNGLFRWRLGQGIVGRWGLAQGLPSGEVWALTPDPRGGVWVGTNKGMVRWQEGRVVQKGPPELADASVVRLVFHGNRLWAGTDLGLFELDGTGRFLKRHRTPEEVGPQAIYDLVPFGPGLLVGTSLGIYDFRDGTFTKQLVNSPLARLTITSLDEDPAGRIWVGTTQGLFGLPQSSPGSHLTAYTRADGMLDDAISWCRTLHDGTLAVGHARGISLIKDGTITPITRAQGLLSDETNHDAALVDSRGHLWIGMIGGISILDTSDALPPLPVPIPRILSVEADGVHHWLPTLPLALGPRPESMRIGFDLGLPIAPQRPLYQVLLEGADKEWRPADGQTPLAYVHPSPGTYRMRVKASLDGRTWTEGAPLEIQVAPAWFQRRLVQVLLGLLAAGVVGGIGWWQVLRQRRRADELEYWVQKRTSSLSYRNRDLELAHTQIKRSLEDRLQLMDRVAHDLRSPLTSIMLSLDRLKEELGDITSVKQVFVIMDNETQRLESILRSLLNRSKAETLFEALALVPTHPSEVLEGLAETLALKAQAKGLRCTLSVDPASQQVRVKLDLTSMHQVLFNLVENALKFTPPGGQVSISSKVEPERWVLEVSDTGRGMSLQQLGRIFEPFRQAKAGDAAQGWGLGLSICRALVDAHRGTLNVESAEGEGSTFRVSLPLLKESS